MIYIFLWIISQCYYIALSSGLFMTIIDVLAIEASPNLRPVAFFKTRKIAYLLLDKCLEIIAISVAICYLLTRDNAYINSIVMLMICYSFNKLVFRPVNEQLCILETFSDDDYFRKKHNVLIIRWLCLQYITTFMITVSYLFTIQRILPTTQ